MTLGESALLEVQWIEMAYNLSGASPPERGSSLCNLDTEDTEGSWEPYLFPPPDHESGTNSHGVSALIILGTLAFFL